MTVTAPEYATPQPAPAMQPAITAQPPRAQRAWLVPAIIGLVAGFILGAGSIASAFALSSPAGDSERQQILSACHEAVKGKLKAPATAQFSQDEITNENTRVWGKVDSQNGFGALVRGSFTCTVTETDGKWKAADVQLSD